MSEVDVEREARSMGWSPKEEFRGDPEKWVDAQTYVERGHTVMPILKANNRRLEEQLNQMSSENARLKELFQAGQEAIEDLRQSTTDLIKQAAKRARENLLAEIKQAREDGDVDREVELTDELADLRAEERSMAKKGEEVPPPAKPVPSAEPELDPALKSWMKDNPWYGTDVRRTLRANAIAQELRADEAYDHVKGREFYDLVLETMTERSGGGGATKVGGSRPSGGAGGGGKKGYSDLPTDAKEACDRQGRRLIGEGRAFKTEADWRQHYADMYFQGE